ncbi:hypothetical protein ScalyP_jg10023 [Parmales sp. scaly parma]|nr:hypothetical protein ScalyP_jg10023 [Parmales sp. scaly parma]
MRRSRGLLLSLALPDMQYFAGRRCLILPKQNNSRDKPPLLLIGGTAQSIPSWQSHYSQLSKDRTVVVYEARGQGPKSSNDLLDDNYTDCSLEKQVVDLSDFLSEISPVLSTTQIDCCGFSFGGRLALAFAGTNPTPPRVSINKLHVTGVAGLTRGAFARVILSAWDKILLGDRNDSSSDKLRLRAFIYSSLLSTYSQKFVAANEKRIDLWVNFGLQQNTVEGVGGIVRQSHSDDSFDVHQSALRLSKNHAVEKLRIIAGGQDALCGGYYEAVRDNLEELAATIGGGVSHKVFRECGHAVLLEDAKGWRQDVLDFLK